MWPQSRDHLVCPECHGTMQYPQCCFHNGQNDPRMELVCHQCLDDAHNQLKPIYLFKTVWFFVAFLSFPFIIYGFNEAKENEHPLYWLGWLGTVLVFCEALYRSLRFIYAHVYRAADILVVEPQQQGQNVRYRRYKQQGNEEVLVDLEAQIPIVAKIAEDRRIWPCCEWFHRKGTRTLKKFLVCFYLMAAGLGIFISAIVIANQVPPIYIVFTVTIVGVGQKVGKLCLTCSRSCWGRRHCGHFCLEQIKWSWPAKTVGKWISGLWNRLCDCRCCCMCDKDSCTEEYPRGIVWFRRAKDGARVIEC